MCHLSVTAKCDGKASASSVLGLGSRPARATLLTDRNLGFGVYPEKQLAIMVIIIIITIIIIVVVVVVVVITIVVVVVMKIIIIIAFKSAI